MIDDLIVQKALAKLRGADAQRDLLTALATRFGERPRSLALIERLRRELEEFGAFQNSR